MNSGSITPTTAAKEFGAMAGSFKEGMDGSAGAPPAANDELTKMLPSFGVGSIISGGIGYAIGHFLLDSPALGFGIATVGALIGQPIMNAMMKPQAVPAQATPGGPAPEKSEGPAAEIKPSLTLEPAPAIEVPRGIPAAAAPVPGTAKPAPSVAP